MSILKRVAERLIGHIKSDPHYRIDSDYTGQQLATVAWHRGRQVMRGLPLVILAQRVQAPLFRGRRVTIEHARQLAAGPGLILENDVFVSALSAHGVTLGRNVTVGRGAHLTCTGVIARIGSGIRIGDRSAVGAGSFLAGQGGITVGNDVIIGPGVRILSENHNFKSLDRTIRAQGESRQGVAIGDDCWIGAGVTILDGVSIGGGSVIAAGAVVTHSLPPYSVAAGVPARVLGSRRAEEAPESAREQRLPPAHDPLPGARAHQGDR